MSLYGSDTTPFDITILVVEDDQSLSRLYKTHLIQQKFRVITALSYDEALIVLSSEPIDIALIDYDLGERKGLDLLKHLPEKIKLQHIPIIVMGNSDSNQKLTACLELGVDDFMLKPINPLLLNLKIFSLVYHVRLAKIVSEQNDKLTDLLGKAEIENQMVSHIMNNHLLSRETKKINGLHFFLKPTKNFSGDIIVARYSPSGSVFILHADATGHGLSATVTLMPMVSIFKAMVQKGYRLESIAREINTTLHKYLPIDRFVAASMVEVDLNHQTLKVWNGGMPSLFLLSGQRELLYRFDSQHMSLGILPPNQFESRAEVSKIDKEAKLISFSDAVLEQKDPMGYHFGLNRVFQVLKTPKSSAVDLLCEMLVEHTGTDQFDDDVSIYEFSFLQAMEAQKALLVPKPITHTIADIAPFNWSLELYGRQIASQELPSQCNQFLYEMGFHQSFCQRVFTMISELVNNAVDHGLLKLTSLLKAGEEGFLTYYQEREERLEKLTVDDCLRISLRWFEDQQGPCFMLDVLDSGQGYTDTPRRSEINDEETHEFGRGLNLVKQLATEVTIKDRGAHVCVTLR